MSRSSIAQTSYLRYPCVDGARGTRAFTHAEVAVHIGVLGDRRRRVARGRWTQDDYKQAEKYAQATVAQWVTDAVLPYLLEQYPDELRRLVSWAASWDTRRDLDEALKDSPWLGTINQFITVWRESRGYPREARDQRDQGDHIRA